MKTITEKIKNTAGRSLLTAGTVCCGLAATFLLAACNEDPEYFELANQPDEMHVRSSVEEIVLNKGISDQAALTLSWDKATSPIDAADEVTYKVCFYPTAVSDNKSEYIDCGTQTQLTLTHDELNTIVARMALPGEAVRVTAQVLSNVHNETRYVKPERSTVEFTATGYEKYPPYLYMNITATADGMRTTQRLEQRQLGTGIYEATFRMTPCTYYFTTSEEPYPAYGQAEGEQMAYVTEGDIAPFSSQADGQRTVIVDTNQPYNDCRVLDIVQLPQQGHIWIVGDGCSIGWNPNSSLGMFEMVGSQREPWIYSWTGEFIPKTDSTEGTFKIGLESGYDGLFFFAPTNNANPLTDHGLDGPRTQGGSDNKWLVPDGAGGKYTLTLYLLATDLHTSFEPAN